MVNVKYSEVVFGNTRLHQLQSKHGKVLLRLLVCKLVAACAQGFALNCAGVSPSGSCD